MEIACVWFDPLPSTIIAALRLLLVSSRTISPSSISWRGVLSMLPSKLGLAMNTPIEGSCRQAVYCRNKYK